MSTKWTQAEDVALTKAYIEVSEDNVVGTDQSSGHFWDNVLVLMYVLLRTTGVQYEQRTKESLTSRWKKHICSKMQKWNEALQRAKREVGSGGQIMEEHELALRLYKSEMKQNWCFQHTWEVASEWIMFRSTAGTSQTPPVNQSMPTEDYYIPTPPETQFESETPPLGDEANPETPHSSSRSERPIGNKKAKKGKGKASSSSHLSDFEIKKLAAMEKSQANQLLIEAGRERRHAEMLQRQREEEATRVAITEKLQEERIMSMDCSSYTPITKAYWKNKRREIANKNLPTNLFGDSSNEGSGWFPGRDQ